MIADLSKLTRRILDVVRRGARTGVTATVQAFDAAKQAITVQPDVGETVRLDDVRTDVPPPVVSGVPVLMYGGQAFSLSYGVEQGDRVVLVYRHRSHDEVDSGSDVPLQPQSERRSQLADVVGLPGYHVPALDRDAARYREDGQPVAFIAGSGALHVGDSTAAIEISRADRTDAQLQEIRDLLTTWVPVASDGGAALKAAAVSLWTPMPTTVATTRLKVDA